MLPSFPLQQRDSKLMTFYTLAGFKRRGHKEGFNWTSECWLFILFQQCLTLLPWPLHFVFYITGFPKGSFHPKPVLEEGNFFLSFSNPRQVASCKHIHFLRTNRFLKITFPRFSHPKWHTAATEDIIMEDSQTFTGKTYWWLFPRTHLIDMHHWENHGSNVSCFTTKTKDEIIL